MLGGVEIEHPKGLAGYLDADAVLHAVTDALLGAIGAGTSGAIFPIVTSPQGSRQLRVHSGVYDLVRARGLRVGNVDVTIHAEETVVLVTPSQELGDEVMRLVAEGLRSAANVKATRGEGLGPIGRGEGIAAQAVVLLEPAE